MIAVLFAVLTVAFACACVRLADAWESRDRARRRRQALHSFYERETNERKEAGHGRSTIH